jgi:hypothetical protein
MHTLSIHALISYHLSSSIVIFFVVLTLLARVSAFFAAVHAKVLLFVDGLIQMVASKDSQWRQPPDWTASNIPKMGSKRIVFIRHGESVWNEVFNRGFNLEFPIRLVRALIREISMMSTPYSILFDTPLNAEGQQQAKDLAQFLEAGVGSSDAAVADIISCLRGDTPEGSLIVSSNLRRALSTAAIGLWRRLDKTREKILIHSTCQEISRNVDCVASAAPGTIPHMEGPDSGAAPALMAHGHVYQADAIFDPAYNSGQKPLDERGVERLQHFADWALTRPEHTIIVAGHSLWFRNFFKAFLGKNDAHPGKSCKMVNVGNTETGHVQWIEPGSIVTVHGGFELPKGSKKEKTL